MIYIKAANVSTVDYVTTISVASDPLNNRYSKSTEMEAFSTAFRDDISSIELWHNILVAASSLNSLGIVFFARCSVGLQLSSLNSDGLVKGYVRVLMDESKVKDAYEEILDHIVTQNPAIANTILRHNYSYRYGVHLSLTKV